MDKAVTVKYWKNGNKKMELLNNGYKTWYENGVLERVIMECDDFSSFRKDYWDNGNLKLEGHFTGETPEGRLRTYHKNGNRKSVETYYPNIIRVGKNYLGEKSFYKKTTHMGIQGFFDVKGNNTYKIIANLGIHTNPQDAISKEDWEEFNSWEEKNI